MNVVNGIVIGLGFLLIIGTAGASDLDPFMPMSQIMGQVGIGLLLMAIGGLNWRSEAFAPRRELTEDEELEQYFEGRL